MYLKKGKDLDKVKDLLNKMRSDLMGTNDRGAPNWGPREQKALQSLSGNLDHACDSMTILRKSPLCKDLKELNKLTGNSEAASDIMKTVFEILVKYGKSIAATAGTLSAEQWLTTNGTK